jgi:hypothetical protein
MPDVYGDAWIGAYCALPPYHPVMRGISRYNDESRQHVSYLPRDHPVRLEIKRQRAERRKQAKRMRDLIYRAEQARG